MNEEPDKQSDAAPTFERGVIPAVNSGSAELPDQMWLEFGDGSPVLLADSFKQRGARLLGLTAYPSRGGEATVCYHYVLPTASGESVFNAKFDTRNRLLPSIADIYPGAGWQEGAIGERYGVVFRSEAAPWAGMLNS
jgi:Respiratory-chain NADH dehydrogenase, 30 Kd subunit